MTTKLCDCNQGRLPCTCKPTADQAEAADLQCWLVANARHLRPVAHSGLMAWALAALQAQQQKALAVDGVGSEATTPSDLIAYRASLAAEQTELAKLSQNRINELVEQLGAARVQMAAQDALIQQMHECLRLCHVFEFDGEVAGLAASPAADSATYDYRADLAAYFGLSYASWLTLPRVLMEAMPKAWQSAMATLLHQYDDAYPNQPELGTTVRVTVSGKIVPTPEWLLDYRHPDVAMINQLRREPAKACSEVRP